MSADALPEPGAPARFSTVAIVLHWTIAALILTNLYLGLTWDSHESRMQQFTQLQLHKSVGITILALSLARLAWRLIKPPPPYPPGLKRWEKAAASAVHWSFYALMIGLPLVGWAIVSVSTTNIPTLLYETIPWPHLPGFHDMPMESREVLEDRAAGIHEALAFIMMALIVLHVGAALKHQFVSKDGVLYRMVPFLRSRP